MSRRCQMMSYPSTNTHRVWSAEHQRWYETRGAESNGEFVKWLPEGWHSAQQVAASAELSYQQTSSNAAPALPRGYGYTLQGNYNAQLGSNAGNLHYETIDPSYYVRDRKFFEEGRVFSVLMTESASSTDKVTDYNSSVSVVNYAKDYVHAQVRRFVVVRAKREFCFACPIFTYSGRATLKPGVKPAEHGIVYSAGTEPKYVSGETGINKPSIAVTMSTRESMLHVASRIYYGIHHPIQYNVKAKEIGLVLSHHLPVLIGNWKAEDEAGTQQVFEGTDMSEEPEFSHDTEDAEEDEDFSNSAGRATITAVQNRSGPSNSYQKLHISPVTRNAYGSGRIQEDASTLDDCEDYDMGSHEYW